MNYTYDLYLVYPPPLSLSIYLSIYLSLSLSLSIYLSIYLSLSLGYSISSLNSLLISSPNQPYPQPYLLSVSSCTLLYLSLSAYLSASLSSSTLLNVCFPYSRNDTQTSHHKHNHNKVRIFAAKTDSFYH